MTKRPLRLGLSLPGAGHVSEMVDQARIAEQLGFDVVHVLDHLGITAPLPPLVAIADAVQNIRVGNLVLNAPLYRPVLLARDLASVDSATGGRLEIGLGAGYAEADFRAAGLRFPTPAERIGLLEEHVDEIRTRFSDPTNVPPLIQTPPPIMIAGLGDKLLALAARRADIVTIGGFGDEAYVANRAEYVRSSAGERVNQLELAFTFFQVSLDDHHDLSALFQVQPHANAADLQQAATLLTGSIEAAADRLLKFHDELGITFFTLHKTEATSWASMEKLVTAIKQRWH